MLKIVSGVFRIGIICLVTSCISVPATGTGVSSLQDSRNRPQSADQAAEDAARAAASQLNGGTTSTSTTTSTGNQPAAQTAPVKTGQQPGWVSTPDSVYPKSSYISAVGYGADKEAADKSALAALVSLFGQSIKADMQLMSSSSEAVSKGGVQTSESTSISQAITTSTALDTLVGAEIGDRWFDSKNTYWAVAVMDKAKTIQIYTDIIKTNLSTISNLTVLTDAVKYSFDGYSRYQLAATIADANQAYARVLSFIEDSAAVSIRTDLKTGDEYRKEARTVIAPRIPVLVQVTDDKSNRIRSALTKSITELGFQSGGTGARYVLDVSASFTEVSYPNQNIKYSRYLIEAALKDSQTGNVLIPYKIDGREGHTVLTEAENRAIAAAEKKIGDANEGFGKRLSDYLGSL